MTLNLGLDLSNDNIVRLGSADKNWQPRCYQKGARANRKLKQKHDTPLQSVGIHYASAFYSTLLSFFVLKIFGFN